MSTRTQVKQNKTKYCGLRLYDEGSSEGFKTWDWPETDPDCSKMKIESLEHFVPDRQAYIH